MHPYATDSDEHRIVILVLALVSVAISSIVTELVGHIPVVPAVSPFALFGAFYAAFMRWVWKWKPLRWIGLVKVPDLNGTWEGHLTSSYDGNQHAITVKIRQDWTRICISLYTANSVSHSRVASLLTNDSGGVTLSYEYINEPRADASASMVPHRGMTSLYLENANILDGSYYTGRGRNTFGLMRMHRTQHETVLA